MSGILSKEMPEILLPERLTFEEGCSFARVIAGLPDVGRYSINFSPLRWIEPFSMLQIASAVSRKLHACPDLLLHPIGYQGNGYAAYMGFFRELGIPGLDEGTRPSNHINYLPIQVLNLREVRADANRKDVAPGKLIDRHTHSIAKTLARQNYGPLWETLQYALREIIRNAAEHSQATHVTYCGQYWASKNQVEVAILDEGIGIYQSLSANPKLRLRDEAQALELSLLPGVSGTAYHGSEKAGAGEWANSGFGLYVVSELCRRGGNFTIVSGQTAIRVEGSAHFQLPAAHVGTALRLVLNTANLRSIAASLELIVAQGEKLAHEHQIGLASASGASKKVVVD